MLKLSELLDTGHVALDIRAASSEEMLVRLVELLREQGHVDGLAGERLAEALRKRERLGCTGIGHGVAVPHAYFADLRAPNLLFVRLAQGIDYGETPDGLPVDLVFLLSGPRTSRPNHLQLLARIVRLLRDDGWLEALRKASSAEDVLAATLEVERRHG